MEGLYLLLLTGRCGPGPPGGVGEEAWHWQGEGCPLVASPERTHFLAYKDFPRLMLSGTII